MKKKTKITVVGSGYVDLSLVVLLEKKNDVDVAWDASLNIEKEHF